jgi:uncharacterized membrane protein YdfJ with MMPL/SSD domain
VFWGLVAVSTNTFIPKVEDVAAELAGPMIPTYAPSQVAMLHIGEKFHESTSTSLTMVVLEADRPLDDKDHQYYDDLMQRLKKRHAARAIRDGSVGQADHRGRRTERRWQSHVCAAAAGR